MATFKAEVYAHQRKQDGTYNIKIRVTHLGKKKYLATPFYVTQADLTRALKIKNKRYEYLCDDIIRGYREKCDDLGLKIKDIDIDTLVEYITRENDAFKLPFCGWVSSCIEKEDKEGRGGTAQIGKNALLAFTGWLENNKDIDINDINRVKVSQFVDYLGTWLKPATTRSYVTALSKYFNKAIETYNDEEDRVRNNPFASVKLPRVGQNTKKALTIEQIKQIRDFVPRCGSEEVAHDCFMLSFYLIGMNAADMLTCTTLTEDGFIVYNRQKTKDRRKDGAEIRVKVPDEAKPIIRKWRAKYGDRLFCFGERWKHWSFNATLNYGLERITKELGFSATFYAARHSWATIAAVDAKIDIYTIHLALNHVSKEMAITEVYIKRDFTAINEANRKVLDLLL